MKYAAVVAGVFVLAGVGANGAVGTGGNMRSSRPLGSSVLVSEHFAAMGTSVASPRGPYAARPFRVTFDEQGRDDWLWVDHLVWVDWGGNADADGVVHARRWPGTGFDVTTGAVSLADIQKCKGRYYYTQVVLMAQNGSIGVREQALTPC